MVQNSKGSIAHPRFTAALFTSQEVETTQMSMTDGWIQKMWYIHKMDYYSVLKRKEIDTCYNIDES